MLNKEKVQDMLVKTLESMIEAVKADNEFQYIIDKQRALALAEVLELNVYARDYVRKVRYLND